MTINKKWDFPVPFTRIKISRSKILKPGQTEKVVLASWDEEMRFPTETECTIKILSEDNLSVTYHHFTSALTNESAYRFYTGEDKKFEDTKYDSEQTYKKEEINLNLLNHGYDESIHERRHFADGVFRSIKGKRFDIEWEPTLPSQARK